MFVADGDGALVERDDAGIGDGDAEDVSGEIVENGVLADSPGFDVNDPVGGPGGIGDKEIGTSFCEQGLEFAAHELGQRLIRKEKILARRVPIAAVIGDAAAGHQTVDMRVVQELLRPGVQDGYVRARAKGLNWV